MLRGGVEFQSVAVALLAMVAVVGCLVPAGARWLSSGSVPLTSVHVNVVEQMHTISM